MSNKRIHSRHRKMIQAITNVALQQSVIGLDVLYYTICRMKFKNTSLSLANWDTDNKFFLILGTHSTLDKQSSLSGVDKFLEPIETILAGVPSPIRREDVPEYGVVSRRAIGSRQT
ncbi:hypothetical protein V6Z11_A08G219000 [Gossypium hirsutum]